MATRKLLQLFALCVVAGLAGCGGGDAPSPAPAAINPPPPPPPPPPTTTTAQSCADPGGTEHGASSMVTADTLWSAAGSPHRGGTAVVGSGAVLSIEAGALVCVAAIEAAPDEPAALSAVGTAQAPIRFFGTALRIASELRHVQGENMPVVGTADRPSRIVIDSTFRWTAPRNPAECMQIVLAADSASGSAMQRSVIKHYGSALCASLLLVPDDPWGYSGGPTTVEVRVLDSFGDGVSASPNAYARFSNCEVSSSGQHGIFIPAANDPGVNPDLGFEGCNLFGNRGDAIASQTNRAVPARANWWGDAAGPGGAGDGVSGNVDASQPLAAPATLAY